MAVVASCLVLIVTGYAWNVLHELSGSVTKSGALGDDLLGSGSASDTTAPTNILIMGLDSRLDQDGNPLPAAVLDQLHAGDSNNGGYNTNVLMLVHLPGREGGPPVAISIPRDDYVSMPGEPSDTSKAKIKEGYGLAKADAERQLRAHGVTDQTTLEQQGREAGRKQTIRTVQDFLGVHVDHFVEVTLVGFYDLAQALGNVTVCLAGPTQDSYSGARFVKGYQQLNAAQSLAFVRQRRDYVHPELNFTDLDRARRQQAFIASVAYQLKSAGTLANPVRLQALISVAAKDVVVDNRFDLLSVAQQASALVGGGLNFTTLPIKAFDTVDGQAVNLVDQQQIRSVVRNLIGPDDARSASESPATLPPATVDIVNATGRDGLAATMSGALVARGMTAGRTSTDRAGKARTTVTYSPDASAAAEAMASLLTTDPPRPDPGLGSGRVRLVLGADFAMPDDLTEPADPGGDVTGGTHRAPPPAGLAPGNLHATGIPCVK